MPEEIEVETEGLHEIIHEKKHEAEHAGQGQRTGWISGVAVTTAVVAAMAAIAALLAGDSVNQSLMLKSEASIKQTERSDQWSFYQAKDTRRFLAEAVVEILQSQPATPASAAGVVRYRSEAEHFKKEKEEIQRRANQLEKDAERLDEEAEKLHMAHERFAPAVTLFQISIALSAIAVLVARRSVWYVGLCCAAAGLAFFIYGFIPPEPKHHVPAPHAAVPAWRCNSTST